MRILVVNKYFPPDSSNSAHALGELCEDLAHRHSVTVITGRPSYNADSSSVGPVNVAVDRVVGTSFGRSSIAGRAADYGSFLAGCLVAGVRAPRPDLVISLTDPPMVLLLGGLIAHRHRVPHVHICHDLYPDIAIALGLLPEGRVARCWASLNDAVYRRSAQTLVVGRDMEERLAQRGVPRRVLSYVPTWAPARPVDSDEDRQRLRDDCGWSDSFVVMHAGNVGLAQNLEIMLEAANELQHRKDIRIVLLGDGADRGRLEALAADRRLTNVEFLAHRPKDQAQRLMSAADLQVVSLVPGLAGCAAPSKTYDIMAAGLPYIAAVDISSEPARIASEWGCGTIVPAGDSDALSAAVLEHASDPTRNEAMGARGRLGWSHGFERSRVTTQIEHALSKALARP